MTTIIVTACLAGSALIGLAFLAVFHGGRLADEEPADPWSDEPNLPTVEEWERQRAAQLAEPSPDDTVILNRYGTRPANDDTVPGWAQTQPVEMPIVTPDADQAVVLTEVVPGRHAAGHVQFVDPDWYNTQLGCTQYPRRQVTLR